MSETLLMHQVLNWECNVITSIFPSEEVSCWLAFSGLLFKREPTSSSLRQSPPNHDSLLNIISSLSWKAFGWQTQDGSQVVDHQTRLICVSDIYLLQHKYKRHNLLDCRAGLTDKRSNFDSSNLWHIHQHLPHLLRICNSHNLNI